MNKQTSVLSLVRTVCESLFGNTLFEVGALNPRTFPTIQSFPERYIVATPLGDEYTFFADDTPQACIEEIRLSLFIRDNYLPARDELVRKLRAEDFTITHSGYVGFDPETGYHQYVVDVEKSTFIN